MKRLYLVVRGDLSAAQQAVQACHALREFVSHYPDVDKKWHKESNTLVLLSVSDEKALNKLVKKAFRRNISVALFREPDINDSLTAVAIPPDGYRLCRRLPLALST